MNDNQWTENVIIADAGHIDQVAFDLTVNFERMIGRRIPPADMARWAECIALDGGLREGPHQTDVILIHNQRHSQLRNFVPGHYNDELNGQAFTGNLGEFTFSCITTEGLATQDSLFCDTLLLALSQPAVKRLMVIPSDNLYNKVKDLLDRHDDGTRQVTVFTMQPMSGRNFRHELLGYSLMSALGIKSSEISPNT